MNIILSMSYIATGVCNSLTRVGMYEYNNYLIRYMYTNNYSTKHFYKCFNISILYNRL